MTTPDTSHRVPAADLDDDTLAQHVFHLHETRTDVLLDGTEDALEVHTQRMLELEGEFLRRFPERSAPSPLRTRAGSRAARGQST